MGLSGDAPVQHVQSVLDLAASPIMAFAPSEASSALLDVPAQADALIPVAADADAKNEAAPSEAHGSPWSANIALVSDYRIAGVTSSGHAGALQGGVDYDGPSGWSVGIWTSTISITEGSNVEVDLYGAKAVDFGDTELSVGAMVIVLPGGDNSAAGLLTASVSTPIGPFDATLAMRYAWPQGNLDNNDDFYVSLNAKTPIGTAWRIPLTFGASVGFERGEFAVEEKKLDWSASLTANIGDVDVGLSYVDTDLSDKSGSPGVILSIRRTF